jgi:glutamate:GABA antiporter
MDRTTSTEETAVQRNAVLPSERIAQNVLLKVLNSFLIATFGVMSVVPVKDQVNQTALAEAIQLAFGPAGTTLAAFFDLIMIGVFIINASVLNFSFGRLLFISGLDRRLPTVMSKVNHNKVPWVAVLVQTVIAGLFVLAIFLIGPIFAENKGNLATLMYYIILAAITIIWTLSTVILFIDVLVIRKKYPQLFANKQLAPNWVFLICSLLGVIASGVGFYATFTAPWVPLIDNTGWVMWISAIAAISLLIGIVMYFIGNISSKGEEISDEELINRVTS